jgi:hypothetical protein
MTRAQGQPSLQEIERAFSGRRNIIDIVTLMKRFVCAVPIAVGLTFTAAQAEPIKIALAETPSDEMAAFFVALDRAKANGLD